jgi:hypothetical protein
MGTIIQKYGKFHYQVKLHDGYMFKRHIKQLRTTGIPKTSVSFAPSTKLEEDDDATRQLVAVQPPWIGPPNLETNLQQSDGRNN